MAVARSRVLDLMKAQCRIFSTTFNPTNIRTGNKVLRQRLKGSALAAYYPRKVVTIRDLQKLYPNFETWDEEQEDRVEHILIQKSRGKGAPKKKRTAAESKKFGKKKR
ncbi:mitochondrial ribosomal subunit S27-domain-containing protein [Cryomyces antarcticus]